MKILIPERLETKRTTLRSFVDFDWEHIHEYFSDPECMRYTIGRPLNESESWRAMASAVGHWVLKGYGPYAIECKESNRVCGIAGLWFPNDWPEPEIKWGLVRSYWGRGYATEAAREVRRMAQEWLPDLSLISLIFSGNNASARVAKTLGATLEKQIIFRDQKADIYRHN